MTKLDQIIHQLRYELGNDFIACQVIGSDGLPIANLSTRPDVDDNVASSRMVMIYKLAKKVSQKLDLGEVEEELITMDSGYFLVRTLGDGSYCMSLAISKDAILGTARMNMMEYAPRIWEAIPHA